MRYALALTAVLVALAGGTAGFEITSDSAPQHPAGLDSKLAVHVADAESTCSPTTVASASGGPASALMSAAAELELAGTGRQGLVYGVIGYSGLAKVWLHKSTTGTFDTGTRLPAPQVTVIDGVSFFIGTLPQSGCDYPAIELNVPKNF